MDLNKNMRASEKIKLIIYNNDLIYTILEQLGCDNIKTEQQGGLFTASLPNGDNPRSVQVRNNEYLYCDIRTRGIENIDIIGLVAYIIYNSVKEDKDYMKYEALSRKWLYNIINNIDNIETKDLDLETKKLDCVKDRNEILDPEEELKNYIDFPSKLWFDEGIGVRTQCVFNIMIYPENRQIIIPIYDEDNNLIGVKARNLNPELLENNKKYIFNTPCRTSINLYGLNIAKEHIKKENCVIIFEAEKSVLKAYQYGYKNSVAIGGKELHFAQVNLLSKYINEQTEIILALDKDVYYANGIYYFQHFKKLANYFKNNKVYVLVDNENKLNFKDAPVDKGKKVFDILIENKVHIDKMK